MEIRIVGIYFFLMSFLNTCWKQSMSEHHTTHRVLVIEISTCQNKVIIGRRWMAGPYNHVIKFKEEENQRRVWFTLLLTQQYFNLIKIYIKL